MEASRRTVGELRELSQEYASYSRSRGGLGNVLGGVAGLIIFAALWLLGPGGVMAVITVGLTVAWLVGKEVIRQRIYRPFGEAREAWPEAQRRGHLVTVGLITAVLAVFLVMIVAHSLITSGPWSVAAPYALFCLVTPWIAWRYLRTANELMVGVYLLFSYAITSAGFTPDRLITVALLPGYAALLVIFGLREHRQFKALALRLRPGSAARP